jgi:hypothetical protein
MTLNRTLLAWMSRRRITIAALALGALLVMGSVAASAAGVLGGVVVCGADRAPGCVIWPLAVSEVVWASFIVGVAALLIWQLRT